MVWDSEREGGDREGRGGASWWGARSGSWGRSHESIRGTRRDQTDTRLVSLQGAGCGLALQRSEIQLLRGLG